MTSVLELVLYMYVEFSKKMGKDEEVNDRRLESFGLKQKWEKMS